MRYFELNDKNEIIGAYIKGINTIPSNAVEVSEAIWKQRLDDSSLNCYENGKLVKKYIRTAEEIAEYEKSLIPKTITLRQARLYLLSIGLLDDLENIISQNRAYQIEWEYANSIERESPLVKILGQTLNLNDEQIDNMFMEASKI